MIKKVIIAILAISIIAGGLYFVKNQNKPTSISEAPKVEAKKFVDESTIIPSKTEEERILVKRDYNKGLEFLKNREISKEEKRKEKLALTIQYIRDLGFEVEEEKETVQVLKYIEGSERTTVMDYMYSYNVLDFNTLLELNKYSNKTYKLKLPNPMGSDFIISYDSLIKDQKNMIVGSPDNILLNNGNSILSHGRTLAINSRNFKLNIIEVENFKNLNFKYKGSKLEKGETLKKVDLSIDLDPNTGKKRYVEFIID